MTQDKLIEYLRFLMGEADRYLANPDLGEREMFLMHNEVQKFKERAAQSDLGAEIQGAIARIQYTYDEKKARRELGSRGGKYWFSRNMFNLLWRAKVEGDSVGDLQDLKNELNQILFLAFAEEGE